MGTVVVPIGIMTGLGLFFAAVLAVAYRFLKVDEDPRLEILQDKLPGTNCGACGQPGCAGFAEALLSGAVQPGGCSVASGDALTDIAGFLGVSVGSREKKVARLQCGATEGLVRHLADYRGVDSCRAAAVVHGGGRACPWGCLGLGECADACTFDVITMSTDGLPVVDVDGCVACGDCVDVCPLDLFVIVPIDARVFVQCNSPLTGDDARSRCSVACDACGRCASDAPKGTIKMVGGLPVIQHEMDTRPGLEATFRCPTGAIVWLEGNQFVAPEEDWEFEGRRRA
jgi:Na+-translocating ferredoxin:NAD+ oxidoreductase subunit B